MKPQTILIADDDPKVLKILSAVLRREGFEVLTASDGLEAVEMDQKAHPDLIVLDIMMPKMDGLEACGRIKSRRDVPIIVLSARGDETDRIVGFKMGVDDYQCKPFSPAEFVLRVKAVLRRYAKGAEESAMERGLVYPNLSINPQTREVVAWNRQVDLTSKEFELLWVLASNPNRVFSRAHLVKKVWESNFVGDESTVTVHIRRLRKKIEKDPEHPTFIKTVWGVGYKFEAD